MAESFKFFKTRDEQRPGLAIDVQMDWITPATMPVLGAALSTLSPKIKRRIPTAWHTYVFCGISDGPPGHCTMSFCEAKTAASRVIPFQTFPTYKEHPWPAVLYSLRFVPDDKFPRSASFGSNGLSGKVYAPSWYTRRTWREGVVYDSRCIVERFLSDSTPFTDAELAHTQPVPGVVEWDFNGASGSMLCLHPDVKIPSQGKAYTTLYNATSGSASAAQIPERIFPATFFEEWTPFVLSDSQNEENGMFFREKVTIYPPPQNDLIIE